MRTLKGLFPYAVLIVIALALRGVTQTTPTPAPSPTPSTPPTRQTETGMGMMPMTMPTHAVATISPASGSSVHGTVTFEKVSNGVRVVADLEGLKPGQHGFHVHEFGDCSSADAKSAGDHFNPAHMSHGAPTDKSRHVGDLGNITAGPDGKAHLEWTDPIMSFIGPQSIIGRSVVVHANADDLKSQPSGNAGAREGCGVIGIAK